MNCRYFVPWCGTAWVSYTASNLSGFFLRRKISSKLTVGLCRPPERELFRNLPDHQQIPGIFCVDHSAAVHRQGRVSGIEHLAHESPLCSRATLTNSVEISVFAVGEHDAAKVDDRCIDTPFISVRVMRISGSIFELPLDPEIGIKLGDEIRSRLGFWTILRIITVRTDVVVIIFQQYRIGPIVLIDGGCCVPSEVVTGHEAA